MAKRTHTITLTLDGLTTIRTVLFALGGDAEDRAVLAALDRAFDSGRTDWRPVSFPAHGIAHCAILNGLRRCGRLDKAHMAPAYYRGVPTISPHVALRLWEALSEPCSRVTLAPRPIVGYYLRKQIGPRTAGLSNPRPTARSTGARRGTLVPLVGNWRERVRTWKTRAGAARFAARVGKGWTPAPIYGEPEDTRASAWQGIHATKGSR